MKSESRPILSILTPAVPSRLEALGELCAGLAGQIGDLPVEHLVLFDNKRRSVGLKRDALLRSARGKYVAFVDDDDDVGGNYISELLKAAESDPDVITFLQHATVNGRSGLVEFKLGNPNEQFKNWDKECDNCSADLNITDDSCPNCGSHKTSRVITKRNAWHVCAWRRSLAIQSHFPDNSYGEDWAFAEKLCRLPGLRSVHVDEILHFYRHDSKTTEAPAPISTS